MIKLLVRLENGEQKEYELPVEDIDETLEELDEGYGILHVEYDDSEYPEYRLPHNLDFEEWNDIANELEDIDDENLVRAFGEMGYTLDDAVSKIQRKEYTMYSNMSLADVAEEFVEDGIFDQEFLMRYIDYERLGDDLRQDGYEEVDDGVLKIDD